jgi:NYN domain
MSAQIEKIALFIDGPNLYTAAKSLGFDIDYKRLLGEFQSRGYLVRAFYYTAVFEDLESKSIQPLIDWLDYNGYTVVTKVAKEFVDQGGRRKVKSIWTSSLRSMPWRLRRTSIGWCYSPETAIFVRSSRRCNGAACALLSCQRCPRSRRWSLKSCAVRLTSSSTL